MTNNLAGVPSIVFGLFGMALFVNRLHFGDSILAGSLTLGLLVLPIIIRTTEESLKSIDDSYRLASYAMGATKLYTIKKVILPLAFPNVITGIILSIGRVSGETAAILFTVAAYFLPKLPHSIFDQVMALPYHLYVLTTSGTNIEASRPVAYGTAFVLVFIVLVTNVIANLIRNYFNKNIKHNMSQLETKNLNFYYGSSIALKNISMAMQKNSVTAFIGPSGCGKSTLLRLFNRMNDLIDGIKIEGEVLIEGNNIYAPKVNVEGLRKQVGMVFQKPNPFPKSIWENVAFGLKVNGMKSTSEINDRVELALKQSALWDEVKLILHRSALQLSGGQQQRLCIARALANEPSILLMDEPASALDPISTAK